MANVWILNHYAQEPSRPGGTRHFSLAKYLRDFGWQASIIAASTEINTGRQRLESSERFRCDRFDDVPFLWVRTPQYRGNGLGRMRNMLAYVWQVLSLPLDKLLPKPDVIVGSSVHPFAAWAGLRLARHYGVPFIFEVRDLWPQTLIDLGRLKPSSPMAILLGWMERVLYREAAQIIVLLPAAGDYICPLGVPKDKVVWLPNGVDLSDFPILPVRREDGKFALMYLGSFGNANGIDQLLAAMALVERDIRGKNIYLRLIGDGPLKSFYQERAKEYGLSRVSFEQPVPKNAVPALASEADALMVCLADLPLYRFGISLNKLFDYLAAARPVIFAGNAINNPIEEAGAGFSVPPAKPNLLADAMIRMSEMPASEKAAMGLCGRQHVEALYSFRYLAEKMARVLDLAVGTGKA